MTLHAYLDLSLLSFIGVEHMAICYLIIINALYEFDLIARLCFSWIFLNSYEKYVSYQSFKSSCWILQLVSLFPLNGLGVFNMFV